MVVEIRRWQCTKHKVKLNINDIKIPTHVISIVDNIPTPVAILPQTMITHQLWLQTLVLYTETHNFSMISRVITQQWHNEVVHEFKKVKNIGYKCNFVFLRSHMLLQLRIVNLIIMYSILQNEMFGKQNSGNELQQALSAAQITDELCSKLIHMWWDLYGN